MPKLKINVFGQAGEDICELDQAGYLFGVADKMIVIDGQRINSYDELLRLAGRKEYRDRQHIQVDLLHTIAGG